MLKSVCNRRFSTWGYLCRTEGENEMAVTKSVASKESKKVFTFQNELGWFEKDENEENIYVNITAEGMKMIAGANRFAQNNMQPLRATTRFPVNTNGMSGVVYYHCLKHDYMYYSENFIDDKGQSCKAGYYSEAGTRRDAIDLICPKQDVVLEDEKMRSPAQDFLVGIMESPIVEKEEVIDNTKEKEEEQWRRNAFKKADADFESKVERELTPEEEAVFKRASRNSIDVGYGKNSKSTNSTTAVAVMVILHLTWLFIGLFLRTCQ